MSGSDPDFTIFGLPLFAAGENPVAIIAIGLMPRGVIAIGILSTGIIAIGQAATGVIVLGQVAAGGFTIAQLGAGLIFIGQLGVGLIVGMGQAAAGFVSNGLGFIKISFDSGASLKTNIMRIIDAIKSRLKTFLIWCFCWTASTIAVVWFYNTYLKYWISAIMEN
jgi:hypothetical protein